MGQQTFSLASKFGVVPKSIVQHYLAEFPLIITDSTVDNQICSQLQDELSSKCDQLGAQTMILSKLSIYNYKKLSFQRIIDYIINYYIPQKFIPNVRKDISTHIGTNTTHALQKVITHQLLHKLYLGFHSIISKQNIRASVVGSKSSAKKAQEKQNKRLGDKKC